MSPSAKPATIPWWVSTIVILAAALSITGAIISKTAPTLLTNGTAMTATAQVYADYFFARSLSIAFMLLVFLILRARTMLAGFMVLVALIQVIDIIDDAIRGDVLLIPGLLILALILSFGATKLLGQGFWHVAAWR